MTELEEALAQEQQAHQETRECLRQEQTTRAHQELRQQQLDEARRRIKKLPYTRMGSSDKLVALDYIDQAAARYHDIADLSQPFHPIMEQVATRLGLSEDQLTRINKAQSTAKAWKYDVKREFKERVGKKEIYNCTVTVELDKLLSDPESIEKPVGEKGAHQGGARVRRCKDCNSDDMDRYALEYCRNCKKAHAQRLPGLRSDANIHDAIDAVKQDRYTIQDYVFEYSQNDHDQEQKHDAFTQEEVQQLNDQLTSTIGQIDTRLQTTPITAETEQKHDAFRQDELTEQRANTKSEQLAEQKHHAPVPQCPDQGKQQQNAEQVQAIESKMQDKVTVEKSLHDAFTEGMRVDTPVGLATVRSIRKCPILHRPRYSVHTDTAQPNGSHYAVFDAWQMQPIGQGVLL